MREPSAMPGTEPISRKPRMLQVDVAHAEVAGAGEEGERDGVDDVGTDEAPRRQRVIEHRQRHDADGAGAYRGQRHEHARARSPSTNVGAGRTITGAA